MDSQNATAEKYIVLRPFNAGGCRWSAGEIFDPTRCTPRLLRQLRDQRRIIVEGEPIKGMSRQRAKWLGINPDSTLSRRPSKIYVPKRAIKPDTAWNGKEDHIYFKHSGKGRYRVFEGDVALTPAMKKDEAEAEAARIIAERRAAAAGETNSGGNATNDGKANGQSVSTERSPA